MSESFWVNRDIKVLTENNLIGTMLVCQAFVPPMKAAGSGSVVNIASVAAYFWRLARSHLFRAEGGGSALYSLPRRNCVRTACASIA
jgi:NAD(P)-dependent dehydrogenase (short-subunit alcohol dehydrogenase family)